MSICPKSTPLDISINIYGFASISAIAFIPNKSYTFLALSAPIPNLSKNPTICHTSQFSIKLSDISTALLELIPLIRANLSGSYSLAADVNKDGNIDAIDYVRIRKYIMNTASLTGSYSVAADVNKDGNIDAIDYVRIRKYIMNTATIEQ